MMVLEESNKIELLSYARQVLENRFLHNNIELKPDKAFISRYSDQCGVFVSLYNMNSLRACLGRLSTDLPLYKTIQIMTQAAATQDYRFPNIEADEISELRIELSILSPLKKITSIDEIIIGEHGIYIEKSGMSGTFLPQVMKGKNWTKEEFLGHCSESKAGLGWEGWKSATIYTYEAIIIKE